MGKKDETPEERATRKEKEKKGATRERNARRSARRRRRPPFPTVPRIAPPDLADGTRPSLIVRADAPADAEAPLHDPLAFVPAEKKEKKEKKDRPDETPEERAARKAKKAEKEAKKAAARGAQEARASAPRAPVLKGGKKAPATGYMDDMDLPSSGSEDETETVQREEKDDRARR